MGIPAFDLLVVVSVVLLGFSTKNNVVILLCFSSYTVLVVILSLVTLATLHY